MNHQGISLCKEKNYSLLLMVAFIVLGSSSLATPIKGDLIFRCKTSSNQTIEVRQRESDVVYRFGTQRKAAMELIVPNKKFKWDEAWGTGDGGNGKGFCFKNLDTTYEVFYSNLNHPPYSIDAGVQVTREGKTLATISCLKGSIRLDTENLKVRKSGRGFYNLCAESNQ